MTRCELLKFLHEDLDDYDSKTDGKSFTCRAGTENAIHYEVWECGVVFAAVKPCGSAAFGHLTVDDDQVCIDDDEFLEYGSQHFDYDVAWLPHMLKAMRRMKKWCDCSFDRHETVDWCYGKYRGND